MEFSSVSAAKVSSDVFLLSAETPVILNVPIGVLNPHLSRSKMFEWRFVVFGMNQAIGGITGALCEGSYYRVHTNGLLLHFPTIFENAVLSQLPTLVWPLAFRRYQSATLAFPTYPEFHFNGIFQKNADLNL